MWRYAELLPLHDWEHRTSLGETLTPVVPIENTGAHLAIDRLYVKDEGRLPTGSFKARGAAAGVSRARELGVTAFAMPTNGNAGSAWSAYGARAGIEAHIVMPRSAPAATQNECKLAGAHVTFVDGTISDAGKIVAQRVADSGIYDASTLKEPYRIEGKKTMGFEIAEQFGWNLPDVILYPAGGGVGLIGIAKALEELRRIGLLDGASPRFVAVQAEGCAPLVRAWREGKRESAFWENAHTRAFGINVPKALGDFLVLGAVYDSHGAAVAVSDEALTQMQGAVLRRDGLHLCAEGAATVAAAGLLRAQQWIRAGERVLCINTAAGVKDG